MAEEPAALTLTTTSLPAATLNTAYSATLAASGGVAPYTFTLANGTTLPAGLTLSAAGAISGTPTRQAPRLLRDRDGFHHAHASLPNRQPEHHGECNRRTSCGNMSTGNGASLNGYVPFPSSNVWNTNIASASIDPNSAAIIGVLTGSNLHPDFSNVVDGNYGIPYVVVDSTVTPGVPVTMNTYQAKATSRSTPSPSPLPSKASPRCTTTGDNHLIVIDKNKCWIYETWQTQRCNGAWSAANGAIWDLTSTEHRPYGWTSADAAGLPIFPGLVRYDEVAAGVINHAFRMTLAQTKSDANGGYFVAPATHAAGNNSGTRQHHGDAAAAQGELRHLRLQRRQPGDPYGHEELRHDRRRQRQQYVLPGSPGCALGRQRPGRIEGHRRVELRRGANGNAYDDATAPTGARPPSAVSPPRKPRYQPAPR